MISTHEEKRSRNIVVDKKNVASSCRKLVTHTTIFSCRYCWVVDNKQLSQLSLYSVGALRICSRIIANNPPYKKNTALRFVFHEKQTPYCILFDNKQAYHQSWIDVSPKIVCTVSKVINSDHASESINELIGHRNSNYNPRRNDI